jgi:YbbR domain-containing protein
MAWHPFRNVGLKAAALALGILLWLTITGQQVERTIPRVPLSYRNVPASFVITDQPESVDVLVRGNSAEVGRLAAGEISVIVDLSGGQPGENVLPLQPDQVRVPLGVDVAQIDPGTVTIWMEPSEAAEVPIRPTIDGTPAAGFTVQEVLVEPKTVGIVGPASRIRPTTTAITERISIDGRDSDVTQMVSVGVSDAQLGLREPRVARVTVRIAPSPVERVLEARPVRLRGLPPGRQADAMPAEVSVTVRGPKAVIEGLNPESVMPYVDLSGAARGTVERGVEVDLPPDYRLAGVSPATVLVRVR